MDNSGINGSFVLVAEAVGVLPGAPTAGVPTAGMVGCGGRPNGLAVVPGPAPYVVA